MKIKLNFLMIIILLVAQFSTSIGTVSAQDEISIGPDLPAALYEIEYSQQLTASGGDGSYTFSLLSGSLPNGFSLSESGLLSGQGFVFYNSLPGIYPITVQVQDATGGFGSRFYNFVLEKGTPTMTPYASGSGIPGSPIYYNHPLTLWAELWIVKNWVQGTANFFVDGNAVVNCQAVALDSQLAVCRDIIMPLSLGEHTFRIDYLPTDYEEYYLPASAGGTFNVGPGSYNITGTLFRDNDQDGVFDYDSEVRLYNSWTINLDQDCDKVVDMTTTTSNGWYQFQNLPGGHCYRISEIVNPGWQQTTQLADFWLSSNLDYGLDIGNYLPTIILSPDVLPSGNVGIPYSQALTASGGATPYTFTINGGTLPTGLILSSDGILAGMPTAGGSFQISVQVVDANQVFTMKNYYLIIKTDGVFTFTSSSNPSTPGESVTFTLSATGDVVDPYYKLLNPAGFVTFYADETPIESCSDQVLNYDGNTGSFGYYPLTCTTAVLSQGIHQISATYEDYFGIYNTPTLALTQNVGTIFINPDTLLGAEYNTLYSQPLTASGGNEPYTFSLLSGTLPFGITFSESGLLSGYPDGFTLGKPGTYPITIQVQDANLDTTSHAYDFVLEKGTPTMTVSAETNIQWNNPFDLYAQVKMPIDESSWYGLSGTVAFTIDGTPVPGCQAVTSTEVGYVCANVSMELSASTHIVAATFTPTVSYADYYYPVSADSAFSVQPSIFSIQGTLFRDINQNGVWDYSVEYAIYEVWTVNLDQGCDGTVDQTALTYYYGYYAFYNVSTSGECYRITADAKPGWQQTSQLEDFRLTEHLYSMNFGFYYPTITLSPDVLPSGNVGVAYNQSFTASGGTGPYTFSLIESTLPTGLTLSEEGILSGIPTVASSVFLTVQAKDANQAVSEGYYQLIIKGDGVFTFTSSANPSAPGDLVTFTVSATGDAIHSYFGPLPPLGWVTFSDNGTPIEGCSDLMLNFGYDEYGNMIFGNYPVTCATATLGTGTHQITAVYIDYSDLYNAPTLAVTQTMQPATSADLSIAMTDSKDPIKPGAAFVYTLTARNAGPNAAESIVIVDTLDRNTTFVSAKAPRGWSCKYVNYAVTCTSLSLSSGGSAIIKINVIVNKTATVGKDLVNNATVVSMTFDPNLINNSVVQKTMVAK